MSQVKSGDVVRIHYTGKLADGTQFDSSAGREPLEFKVGSGQIIPGLDRQIQGMKQGESGTLTIPAAEAYGARDENQVQVVPRTALPPEMEVQVGSNLQATTPDGNQISLTVVGVSEAEITVDANHPLAGHDLVFEIEIVEVVAG
ncbi:peptidylprolyl isomerase [Nitratireductor aquimarinus]|uniref:FKBP-type peptidyl-prolyl cis-trans isomerase n=1 Tax=Alphaproteobacteria TaxID=28211 RepID=UPI000DDFD026|nr:MULTISPECIES: peptidylprolyl isomerase [Alphaproteobacteria]MBY6022289.1 peptidylprolyl isomerase [Nitratireductor sp. DP7N14-4]MBN7757500.1 peptidylprolyl isomerase [Nitratireductor aquimarinus]MBN7762926.1 peptidylprolyl isomerase [Nitratireductor aquibiodomus]MBN7774891.1 peptidylprolyl isomerase [Nitratireductor pacificus]MBN7779752.1 peptidylprolyl isomerase [Nitratireductor pacificus]